MKRIRSSDSDTPDRGFTPYNIVDLQFDERKAQFEKQCIQSVAKKIASSSVKPFSNTQSGVSTMVALKQAAGARKPSLITRHIMIGGRDDVSDLNALKEMGVSHILNLTNVVPNHFPDSFVYYSLPLTDAEHVNISQEAPSSSSFIRRAEKLNGRVMVHCVAGVSRSVTLVIMHLMAVHGLRLKHAYEFVESIRSFIAPNDGFKLQLALMEVQLFHQSSIAHNKVNRPGYHKAWDFFGWNNIKSNYTSNCSSGSDKTYAISGTSSSSSKISNHQSGSLDLNDFTPPPPSSNSGSTRRRMSGGNLHSGITPRRPSVGNIPTITAGSASATPRRPSAGSIITPSPRSSQISPGVSPRAYPKTSGSTDVSTSTGPKYYAWSGGAVLPTISQASEGKLDVSDATPRDRQASIGNIEDVDSPMGKLPSRRSDKVRSSVTAQRYLQHQQFSHPNSGLGRDGGCCIIS